MLRGIRVNEYYVEAVDEILAIFNLSHRQPDRVQGIPVLIVSRFEHQAPCSREEYRHVHTHSHWRVVNRISGHAKRFTTYTK
jgi:hypothetical protein